LSVILAAGLKGIEEGYDLPPEVADNVFQMTPAERAAAGIDRLPESLWEALEAMERSELVAEALGEHVFGWFLRNKRKEWERYQQHVSRYELETYLPILGADRCRWPSSPPPAPNPWRRRSRWRGRKSTSSTTSSRRSWGRWRCWWWSWARSR